jgi:hypothetical protein
LCLPPLLLFHLALQFTRLCNGILRRLGKHQVVSTARLMMLIASTAPLMDRSGLNSIVSDTCVGCVFWNCRCMSCDNGV